MNKHPSHSDSQVSLKRIEGQIRGIQKMIEEKRYCVDILTQLTAACNAINSVQDNILGKHMHTCVSKALYGKSDEEKQIKIDEIMRLLKTFRKSGK